jgi:hypothetical protein
MENASHPDLTRDPYVSLAALAERTGLSASYWRQRVRNRRVRSIRVPSLRSGAGRAIRINLSDAEAYLASLPGKPSSERVPQLHHGAAEIVPGASGVDGSMSFPEVTAASRKARAAIEEVLDLLGWPRERALSLAMDRLVQLEEGGE